MHCRHWVTRIEQAAGDAQDRCQARELRCQHKRIFSRQLPCQCRRRLVQMRVLDRDACLPGPAQAMQSDESRAIMSVASKPGPEFREELLPTSQLRWTRRK